MEQLFHRSLAVRSKVSRLGVKLVILVLLMLPFNICNIDIVDIDSIHNILLLAVVVVCFCCQMLVLVFSSRGNLW